MKLQNSLRSCFLLAVLTAVAIAQTPANSSTDDKPASISGIVKNSVTGEPLAHTHLSLDNLTQKKGGKYGAITRADGHFSITAIAPGDYHLFADRRGFRSQSEEAALGKVIELKSGQQMSDIVVRLVPDAVISGTVVDASGSPMARVDVTAVGGEQPHLAMTDDRGEFRIGGLREGPYLVKAMSNPPPLPPEVRSDGTHEINYGPTYYPNSSTPNSATPVRVRAGEETSGIEIKLAPSPVVRVTGAVYGPFKDGANVAVELHGEQTQRSIRVGPDRTFTIWRAPPGHYLLVAEYYDFPAGKRLRSAPVQIDVADSNMDGLQLAVAPSFELSGRLQLEGGASWKSKELENISPSLDLHALGSLPNSDADVIMNPADGTLKVTKVANVETDTTMDQQGGSFKITNLYPGRYRVQMDVLPAKFYIKSVRLDGIEFPDGIIDLPANPGNKMLTVEIGKDGPEISGVVRNAQGPAAGMEVVLLFDGLFVDVAGTTVSGDDGAYTFHGVTPGKYQVLAHDPKEAVRAWSAETLALYQSVTERFDVSVGDKVTQDLKLLP